MNEFTKTILIALIPSAVTAILSFFSSYFLAKRKCYEEFKKITEEHKNELEKLMKQHAIDIDSLNQKHANEMEIQKLKHSHDLEIKEKEYEMSMKQKEKEVETQTMYGVLGTAIGDLMNSPAVKQELHKQLKDAFNKK